MNEQKSEIKYIVKLFFILSFIVLVGTTVYKFLEPTWSLIDCFYMTIITITTVGFREIGHMSDAAKIFTVFLIFAGLGSVAFFGGQITKLFFEKEFGKAFKEKKMQKIIEKMKNHYIICGHGRIGQSVSSSLLAKGIPFVVIENNDEVIEELKRKKILTIKGNATLDQTLFKAGINKASGLVACLSSDSDNLFISLASRELNRNIFIVSRGEEVGIEEKMLRAGADIVVSPLKLGGEQLADLVLNHIYNKNTVTTDSNIATTMGMKLKIYKVSFNDSKGKITIEDIIKKENAISAVALKIGIETTYNPDPQTELNEDEIVILLTDETKEVSRHISREKNIKIFLIDHDKQYRDVVQKKLEAVGYNVETADDGETALQLFHLVKPKLVIIDANTPLITGFDVCKVLKRRPDTKDLPVILYSEQDDDKFREKARESGANAHLPKTAKVSYAMTVISNILKKHGLE